MKKIGRKILLIVVMILMMNCLFVFTKVKAIVRVPKEEHIFVTEKTLNEGIEYTSDNAYYIKDKELKGQCTWYCWGRMYEKTKIKIPFTANANKWYETAYNNEAWREYTSTTLRENSVIVLKSTTASPKNGHVIFVEKIDRKANKVYLSEGNFYKWTSNPADGYSECTATIEECQIGKFIYGGQILGYIRPPEEKIAKIKVENIPDTINLNIKESEYKKADPLIIAEIQKYVEGDWEESWNIRVDWNSGYILDYGEPKPLDAIHKVVVNLKYKELEWNKEINLSYSNSQNYNEKDYYYVRDLVEGMGNSTHISVVETGYEERMASEYDVRNTNFNWLECIPSDKKVDSSIKIIPHGIGNPVDVFVVREVWQPYCVYIFKDDVLYCGHVGDIRAHVEDAKYAEMRDNSIFHILINEVPKIVSNLFKSLKDAHNSIMYAYGEKITWKFRSEDIVNSDIDLNTEVIVSDLKNARANLDITDGVKLDFKHEGELPGKATVEIDIGTEKFGEESKALALYYYKEETNEAKYIEDIEYKEGKLEFSITHCSSYIVTEKKKEVSLTTSMNVSKEILNPGEEFDVDIYVHNLQTIEKGIIALGGELKFDTDKIEIVSMTGKNGWSNHNTFNETNFKFVTDNNQLITEDGIVFTARLRIKENVQVPQDVVIKLENIRAANGEGEIIANDTQVNLKIEEKSIEADKITSQKYQVEDGCISKILPDTTLSELKKNVEANREILVMDKNGNWIAEDQKVGTGMTLKVGNLEFVVSVIGDLDGNGQIGINDLAKLKLHYIEAEMLTEAYLKSADLDDNSMIGINDIAQIKLVLIGLMTIE